MAIDGVIRFKDLVSYIPGGSYYLNKGTILPYRLGNTTLRLATGSPNTKFGLYLDEKFTGEVQSDANGNVIFSRHLDRGDIEVTLISSVDGSKIASWVSVREYALWLVAYAEILESIDDNIQTATDDLFIERSTSTGIEDHFGEAIGFYKDLNQDLDTYRWQIHGIRGGFRDYGTRYRGLETVAAEITHIPPFGYARRNWGPNWVLDQNMVVNHRFLERSHLVEKATNNVTGVEVLRVEPDVAQGAPAGTLSYNPGTNELDWTTGPPGTPIIAVDGELFLPGPESATPAYILGLAGAYGGITAGNRDHVYLEADGLGIADIQLVTGLPGPTTANVATDINFELSNPAGTYFLQYGVAYAAFASVYNGKLLLRCPAASGSNIQILHGPENAAVELFGNKPGDLTYGTPVNAGAETLTGVDILLINGNLDISGNSDINYEFDNTVTPWTRRIQWRSNNAAYGAWVDVENDGTYVLTDSLGYTCRVHCIFDEMPELPGPGYPDTDQYYFSVGFRREDSVLAQREGLWVSVTTEDLPTVGLPSDNVNVYDDATAGNDELPDNWRFDPIPVGATFTIFLPSNIITVRDNPLDPSPAYRVYFNSADTEITLIAPLERFLMPRPGPRGQSYPQRSSGMLYDYEGYNVTFGAWFLADNMGAAPNVTLSFSWDDGVSWINGTSTAINNDAGGAILDDATYVSFTTRIPAEVDDNGALVKVYLNGGAFGLDFTMDSPSVEVEYITSRSLTRSTIPRTRHRQYFGDLVYVWSSRELSSKQKKYLGVFYRYPEIDNPFAGVTITSVSGTTPLGDGTLEYEYNATGPTYRLRWNPSSGDWAPGNGWVTIPSDGTYTLYGLDSTYLVVEVVQALLPVISGTPPAATTSRTIEILDISGNQGLLRQVSPAHSSLDIFDVSHLDQEGDPINVKGAVTEADFAACTLINLDIVSADPIDFSYLIPNVEPIVGEDITFASPAPHLATLAYESDQDQTEAILYEDGVPLPNDDETGTPVWWFNSSTQIQIDPGPAPPTWFYNSSATYTLDYNPLFRVTTPTMDLGLIGGYGHSPYGHYPYGHPPHFLNYVWLIDYYLWDRKDSVQDGYTNTVPVYFNANNGRAYLEAVSDMNMTTSTLFYQGEEEAEVPKEYWRYLKQNVIELNLGQLQEGVQYFLTYEEQRVYKESRLTVTLEHRYGANEAGCLAASWTERERNEVVPVYDATMAIQQPWHQLRLSVSGIRDLKDFKIKSLVLKGLPLHDVIVGVPGITDIE